MAYLQQHNVRGFSEHFQNVSLGQVLKGERAVRPRLFQDLIRPKKFGLYPARGHKMLPLARSAQWLYIKRFC